MTKSTPATAKVLYSIVPIYVAGGDADDEGGHRLGRPRVEGEFGRCRIAISTVIVSPTAREKASTNEATMPEMPPAR